MSTSAQLSKGVESSQHSSWLRPKYLLFAFIGLLYAYVLVYNEGFLINLKDPEWHHIESFKWWLLPHGLAGACALILGPMQFSDRLRQRFTKLHRVMGRFYIASVFIAAPLGVYIQYLDEPLGSPRSFTIETVVQSGLWMLTTGIALAFIMKGKVQQHRQWMTRSFGTGPLIFLEARVIFHLAGVTTPFEAETVVWICTACSIFVADLVLQFQELLRTRPIAAKSKIATPVSVAGRIEALPLRQE
jgi:uncharacterized membrane protein